MSTAVKDLIAWQQAMDLVVMVYRLTAKLPKEELYGLTSQMRRCAVSVASNIAEGQGRSSKGEFYQFLGNARGSIEELRTQLLITQRLKFVVDLEADDVLKQLERVTRLVNGLMQAIKPRTLKATAGE
jgi:four helix bundle protein